MLMDDPIRLWVPLCMEPNRDSLMKAAGELPDSVIVKGLVSSEKRDLDKEKIRQDGLDWHSWFLVPGQGSITYGHTHWELGGPVIGRPKRILHAQLEDGTPATWLEASLWLRTEYGLRVYREHQAALAAGDVGMGFSIEGTALERDPYDPTIVLRAIIYSVAIAFQQKNPVAAMDPITVALAQIAKAMAIGAPSNPQGEMLSKAMRAFMGGMQPDDLTRLSLLKDVSNDDLRALRIARQCPDLTFSDASLEVASFLKGHDR